MNPEQQAVRRDADCGTPSVVSVADWQALKSQLMALALGTEALWLPCLAHQPSIPHYI